MAKGPAPWRVLDDGVRLNIRLQPAASQDAIVGQVRGADGVVRLKVRVRAVAEKGRANAALERLLARHLSLARRAVTLVGGGKERNKQVKLTGDPDILGARLHDLLATLSGPG